MKPHQQELDETHKVILQAIAKLDGKGVLSKYLVTLLPVEMNSRILVRKLVWLEKRGAVRSYGDRFTLGFPKLYWQITPLGLELLGDRA